MGLYAKQNGNNKLKIINELQNLFNNYPIFDFVMILYCRALALYAKK